MMNVVQVENLPSRNMMELRREVCHLALDFGIPLTLGSVPWSLSWTRCRIVLASQVRCRLDDGGHGMTPGSTPSPLLILNV